MKKEVIFTGIGGQGIVKSAVLLAQAGMNAGHYAAQTARYDAAARGAVTEGEAIISSEEIDFPHVHHGDVHVSFNQAAFEKYNVYLREDGIVYYDSSVFSLSGNFTQKIIEVPATKMSIDLFGKPGFANIIMLGAISNVIAELDEKYFTTAISQSFKRFQQENLKAFALGREIVG